MSIPFTTIAFLEAFARYNRAVWPAQLVFYALALAMIASAIRGTSGGSRAISLTLAVLWAWMGIVYHLMFFAAINPAAPVFAALFIAQGVLFAWAGARTRALSFAMRGNLQSVAGGLLILYALVGYPALGAALGHRYPAAPTFGLPCPTVIFTFGLLLWADRPVPWLVLPIPAIWALVGTSAALQLGMREDFGLIIAVAAAGLLLPRTKMRVAPV